LGTHVPLLQVSGLSQSVLAGLPQAIPLRTFTWVQPVTGEHASVVQALLSLQLAAAPPVHTPVVHVSPVVHAFPSLHADPLGSAARQLLRASLQVSAQFPSPSGPGHGAVPATQAPL